MTFEEQEIRRVYAEMANHRKSVDDEREVKFVLGGVEQRWSYIASWGYRTHAGASMIVPCPWENLAKEEQYPWVAAAKMIDIAIGYAPGG